jgi:hypothetical protein
VLISFGGHAATFYKLRLVCKVRTRPVGSVLLDSGRSLRGALLKSSFAVAVREDVYP